MGMTGGTAAQDDAAGASWSAVLDGDEATVRRLADLFEALNDDGAMAVAAFEIAPDEAREPPWRLSVHFPTRPDEDGCRALIAEACGAAAAQRLRFEAVAQADWVATSLAGLAPVSCGRVLVHGSHDRDRVAPNRIGIEIEAALAFGTGHHGTTLGCLMLLDRLFKTTQPDRILDLGTGTGVLAIAAARLTHRAVLATDIDPVAVEVACDNMRLNGCAGLVHCVTATGFAAPAFAWGARFDLVIANILAEPLRQLAPDMRRHTEPGAHIVLSGILPHQADSVIAAYRAQGFHLRTRLLCDRWASLLMQRPARRPTRRPAHRLRGA